MSIEVICTLKIKEKKVLRYFFGSPILIYKISTIFTRLSNHTESWHLHSLSVPQNFRKIVTHILKLLQFLILNTPTDKNAFGQFGGFSSVDLKLTI